MPTKLDPQYTFSFVSADNTSYTRRVYWERLYAFFPAHETVLAAARILPHHNLHYALYRLLKSKGREVHRELLPETAAGTGGTDFISNVTELIHYRAASPPAKVIADAGEGLAEAFEQVMVARGVQVTSAYLPDPIGDLSGEEAFPAPTFSLGAMADLSEEDVRWFSLSCRVQALVEEQLQETLGGRQDEVRRDALVHGGDLGDDLYSRLYSNPKYLEFVKRVMDAKGGYASPLVRHFVSFYAKSLNRRIRESIQEKQVEAGFLKERVEGVLGKEEAGSLHVLPAYGITILGRVEKGILPLNEEDPEKSGKSYQVDPGIDPGELLLIEISDRVSRIYTKGFIWYVFGRNHCARSITFVADA